MSKPSTPIEMVERLLNLLKFERYTYLSICFVCCIALIFVAVYLIINGGNLTYILGLFGSTGIISVAIARIMKIWNDVIKILFKENLDSTDGK